MERNQNETRQAAIKKNTTKKHIWHIAQQNKCITLLIKTQSAKANKHNAAVRPAVLWQQTTQKSFETLLKKSHLSYLFTLFSCQSLYVTVEGEIIPWAPRRTRASSKRSVLKAIFYLPPNGSKPKVDWAAKAEAAERPDYCNPQGTNGLT